MVAAVPVLSLVLMLISSKVKIGVSAPEFAIINGNSYITISIANSTFIPITSADINISYEIYELNERKLSESTLTVVLLPFSKQKIKLEQTYDKCIFLKFKIDSIVVHDFLGIFHRKIKCAESSELSIIPNIYSDIEIPNLSLVAQKDADVYVREFRDGDHLAHIHQKLSAKSEVNYTRAFEEEVNLPLLTLNIAESDDINKALEEYAVTAYTLISDNISVEMLNLGFDVMPTMVNDIDTLQKHLVNVTKNINTQKYNEYISDYRRHKLPIAYY
jgi:hypothetical protein